MIKAEIIVELDGKHLYTCASKSLLQNFGKLLCRMLGSPGTGATSTSTTVTDTVGSPQTVYCEMASNTAANFYASPLAMNAADNDDTYGIVVGSGTATVTPTDYSLASKIPHGTGSGQLDYGVHTATESYTGASSYCEISRSFTNVSGAEITVREVGLIARNRYFYPTSVDVKFLIARDVLPSPVRVKNLGSLTVRYRISLTL
jgi:hypothetical protein